MRGLRTRAQRSQGSAGAFARADLPEPLMNLCHSRMGRLLSWIFRRWKMLVAVLLIFMSLLVWKAWSDTMGDPVVLRAEVTLPGLPAGSEPITAALISDIHVAGPDMPPERLARIVEKIKRARTRHHLHRGRSGERETHRHAYLHAGRSGRAARQSSRPAWCGDGARKSRSLVRLGRPESRAGRARHSCSAKRGRTNRSRWQLAGSMMHTHGAMISH